jgi:Mitochondrial carrier protein
MMVVHCYTRPTMAPRFASSCYHFHHRMMVWMMMICFGCVSIFSGSTCNNCCVVASIDPVYSSSSSSSSSSSEFIFRQSFHVDLSASSLLNDGIKTTQQAVVSTHDSSASNDDFDDDDDDSNDDGHSSMLSTTTLRQRMRALRKIGGDSPCRKIDMQRPGIVHTDQRMCEQTSSRFINMSSTNTWKSILRVRGGATTTDGDVRDKDDATHWITHMIVLALQSQVGRNLLVSALVTVIFEGCIGHILEFLKIVMQTAPNDTTTYLQVIRTITAEKGIAGLWDGFCPWGIVQAVCKGAVFGLAHASALQTLKPLAEQGFIPMALALTLAGGIGGGFQGYVLSPTLLLKTRVMTVRSEFLLSWK